MTSARVVPTLDVSEHGKPRFGLGLEGPSIDQFTLEAGEEVGAGFSASSANEDASARGKAAGLIAAIIIVVLMLAAAPWLALLPETVLAAVVISALTHALDPRPLLAL